MERSSRWRLIRAAMVIFVALAMFSSVAGGASAMKVASGAIIGGQVTPVVGVVKLPPQTPVATVNPLPTDVAVEPVQTDTPAPTDVAVQPVQVETPVATDGSAATDPNQTSAASNTGKYPGYTFLYFDLFVCPKGYNPPADGQQAIADCTTRASKVSMHLIDRDGDHPQTASNSVSWLHVEPGPVTIKQDVGTFQKAPFVFCRGVNGVFIPQTIADGAMNTAIADNGELYCAWFITPKPRPTDGVVATVTGVFDPGTGGSSTADPGSLTINGLSACPAGFDVASADIYGLALNCHDAAPLLNYHIAIANGTLDQNQVGIASFGSVPAGAQSVSVDIPGGWGTPRVFCKSKQGDSESEATVANDAWTVTILSSQDAYCDVFSIPTQPAGGAAVISDAGFCYDGMLNGDYSHANLANTCFPDANVTFIASAGGQQLGQATTANGPAQIGGLPAGLVQIQGITSEGPNTRVIVFCDANGSDRRVNSTNSTIHLHLFDDETVNCHWFFVTPGYPLAG